MSLRTTEQGPHVLPLGEVPETYSLWYYPIINRFVSEDGIMLHDMHELFDNWELERWKETKKYGLLMDKRGYLVEIYYEKDVEEDLILHAFLCSDGADEDDPLWFIRGSIKE